VSTSTTARHRKPPQHSAARSSRAARQQKSATQPSEAVQPQQAPAQPVRAAETRQAPAQPGEALRQQLAPTQPARIIQPQQPPVQADEAPQAGKLPAIASALHNRTVRLVVTAVVALTLMFSFWPAAAHFLAQVPSGAWADEADVLGLQAAGALGLQAKLQPEVISMGVAVAPMYLNPLRDVPDLTLERIDQGVDFNGSGPVFALGDGVVLAASADYPGWEGGWITYRLSNGPAAGLVVYVAEDVTPTVQAGDQVTPSTVIGNMYDGGGGIETGWAQPSGLNAESQLTVAGGIGGAGPFPTAVGFNFDQLLQSLGVPAAPNAGEPASGILPAGYPTNFG
jgi:murein DD-endopeptidase MepM/ murein hydrolase activator NlpD